MRAVDIATFYFFAMDVNETEEEGNVILNRCDTYALFYVIHSIHLVIYDFSVPETG